MPGFDHGTNVPAPSETRATAARNTRYGLALFAVYLVLYGAFVLVNAFVPAVMERTPIAGVNLAILSGFGLIGTAFVLAMVYGWLCRSEAPAADEEFRP